MAKLPSSIQLTAFPPPQLRVGHRGGSWKGGDGGGRARGKRAGHGGAEEAMAREGPLSLRSWDLAV